MKLRDDMTRREVVHAADLSWVPSPSPGVERRMLDRVGDEVARATSLVRYEPGAAFPSHRHDMGEEFLVIEGTFLDEHGRYPTGTYVRNPWGTSHAPRIEEGCVILVKLRQMVAEQDEQVVIDTNAMSWELSETLGLWQKVLYEDDREVVTLERWDPGTRASGRVHTRGEEFFVVEGTLADEHGSYGAHTWVRLPRGSVHTPYSEAGCVRWLKRGHL